MSLTELLLFLGGGFLAGIINTLAGNGSAITLSLLIFTGMPANVANATNRIGALVQTLTAVVSLRRTKRTRMLLGHSVWFFLPAILGSVVGAYFAVDIHSGLLEKIIGGIMLLLLASMLYSPKKWACSTDAAQSRKTVLNWILVFVAGLYAGFIQMGIGIVLLSILVLIARYSLRDANIIKLLVALIFVIPAFAVFIYSGQMRWLPGIVLAIGQGIGAVIAARYILFLPMANKIVRYLLIVLLAVSAFVLLGLPEFFANLLA